MITRREANSTLIGGLVLAATHSIGAQAQQTTRPLPKPETEGGKPLMQALKLRQSRREYSDRPLPAQVLSNLLWAAWGINRPEEGLHTAPNWRGKMDIDIYLAMADGTWLYDAKNHRLSLHMTDDVRGDTTAGQPFVKTAPLNLIYVSDAARFGEISTSDRMLAGIADTAVISQNVYLFCASEGLATVVRGLVPRERLADRLKLAPMQAVYLAQTVGYPKG